MNQAAPLRASVGAIGVGNMGAAMVHRLLDCGVSVAVRDIRPEAEVPLLERGATRAASPADIAARSDVILVVVVDAAQIRTVLFDGPEPAEVPVEVVDLDHAGLPLRWATARGVAPGRRWPSTRPSRVTGSRSSRSCRR